MKVSVLASGSKGNSSYFETEKLKCLIDIGMSCAYIERNLQELGVDPRDIDLIFLTHTHSDHINGLKTFLKKYNTTVCLTQKMHNDLEILIKNVIYLEQDYTYQDLNVKVIKTSHDVSDSNGYIMESKGKSFVYITDTGYINVKNHKYLKDKNLYVLESNHDVQLLMEGKYPHHLKNRIQGDSGHLSNAQCGEYLCNFIGTNTLMVFLAHLSEENNTPDKAIETIVEKFNKNKRKTPTIKVAKQKERTELVVL